MRTLGSIAGRVGSVLFGWMHRMLGRRRGQGLVDGLVSVTENPLRVFTTFHVRPASASFAVAPAVRSTLPRHGLVVQGPIVRERNFTLETVRLYRIQHPGAPIVVSTWSGQREEDLDAIRKAGAEVLVQAPPANAGIKNINLQIASSRCGLARVRELGADFIAKTRTDQRVFSPHALTRLQALLSAFPVRDRSGRQRARIIGVDLNTFKHRLYGLSDMLIYGHAEDVQLYWNAPEDGRRLTAANLADEGTTLRAMARLRICEVYLATHFLEALGRPLAWTLEDSWRAFADHFCVIDRTELDLLWPKYNRREFPWLDYPPALKEELSFADWLSYYLGRYDASNDALLDRPVRIV